MYTCLCVCVCVSIGVCVRALNVLGHKVFQVVSGSTALLMGSHFSLNI